MDINGNLKALHRTNQIQIILNCFYRFSKYRLIFRIIGGAFYCLGLVQYTVFCFGAEGTSSIEYFTIVIRGGVSGLWAMCYSKQYCRCLDRLTSICDGVTVRTSWFREIVMVMSFFSFAMIILFSFDFWNTHEFTKAIGPGIYQFMFIILCERFLTIFCMVFKSVEQRVLGLCELVSAEEPLAPGAPADAPGPARQRRAVESEARAAVELKSIVHTYVELMACCDDYHDMFSIPILVSLSSGYILFLENIYMKFTAGTPWPMFYKSILLDGIAYASSLIFMAIVQHTMHVFWEIPRALARLHNTARGARLRADSKLFLRLAAAFPPRLQLDMESVTTVGGSVSLLANCVVTLLQFLGVL